MINWKDCLRASGIHLCISLFLAVLAALLVFGLWYPWPYRDISGGRELFLILVAVDVLLGPLITLAIFNRAKPARLMRMDFAIIGLLQLAALGYGLWTMFLARPVHLVFEIYRFRVVHAIEVPRDMLKKAPVELQALPVFGPTLASVRPFKNDNERIDATFTDLGGLPIGARPDLCQSYEAGKAQILESLKPVGELKTRLPAQAALLDQAVAGTGRKADELGYAPLIGRKNFWVVLMDRRDASVLAYVPVDPF
jgi:hypothetical protein